MMGVTGISEVITYFVKRHKFWRQVLRVPNFFHLGSGIVVFVLFILKRSTFQMIMER